MSVGWWIRRLDELPRIPPEQEDDPDWLPLQHHFGFTAFGVNVYTAGPGRGLIADHDETEAGHEELYVVIEGEARFVVDGEVHAAPAGTVVAVRDPRVRRQAIAVEPATTVVAIGGRPDPGFRSSWQEHHFEDIPRVE